MQWLIQQFQGRGWILHFWWVPGWSWCCLNSNHTLSSKVGQGKDVGSNTFCSRVSQSKLFGDSQGIDRLPSLQVTLHKDPCSYSSLSGVSWGDWAAMTEVLLPDKHLDASYLCSCSSQLNWDGTDPQIQIGVTTNGMCSSLELGMSVASASQDWC